MIARVALAALLLVVVGATPLPTDPIAFVRGIYAAYRHDNPPAWYELSYSARLRAMIDADRAQADKEGDAGKFDWDPLINAQDWKLGSLTVSLVSRTDDHATVDAKFRNLGAAQQMRFFLALEAGQWAIDDLQALNKPRWTMSKVYLGAPDAFTDETKR